MKYHAQHNQDKGMGIILCLFNISNELAEANRLKRIEIKVGQFKTLRSKEQLNAILIDEA